MTNTFYIVTRPSNHFASPFLSGVNSSGHGVWTTDIENAAKFNSLSELLKFVSDKRTGGWDNFGGNILGISRVEQEMVKTSKITPL